LSGFRGKKTSMVVIEPIAEVKTAVRRRTSTRAGLWLMGEVGVRPSMASMRMTTAKTEDEGD
jgi:hypothetical protein